MNQNEIKISQMILNKVQLKKIKNGIKISQMIQNEIKISQMIQNKLKKLKIKSKYHK